MSYLAELDAATAPLTIDEWLSRFSEDEQQKVRHAILTHAPSRIYPILKELEHNPYPFTKDSLSKWARKRG